MLNDQLTDCTSARVSRGSRRRRRDETRRPRSRWIIRRRRLRPRTLSATLRTWWSLDGAFLRRRARPPPLPPTSPPPPPPPSPTIASPSVTTRRSRYRRHRSSNPRTPRPVSVCQSVMLRFGGHRRLRSSVTGFRACSRLVASIVSLFIPFTCNWELRPKRPQTKMATTKTAT